MVNFDPVEVTELDVIHGGKAMELLPDWDDIPTEFKRIIGIGETKWNRAVNDLVLDGPEPSFIPKKGVEPVAALRHVLACLSSPEPRFEHKFAGCAYLLSQWFEDVKYVQVTS